MSGGGEAEDGDGDGNGDDIGGESESENKSKSGFDPDPERVRLLRETAEDVRGDTTEREQLAALLYRVSDLYDSDEETTPEEIHRNVRTILRIKARGGLELERDE